MSVMRDSFKDELLNLLSNVLFPIVVFLILAAMTTVGTIVTQNMPPDQYYQDYPAAVANVILRLHLTNVFHSVPYVALVVLLLVSMAVCTFRRVIPKRFPKDRAVPIRNFGLHGQYTARAEASTAAAVARRYFETQGFRIHSQDIDGDTWLFGHKQKWARYGVLVAHLGFVVLTFGIFLGWLKGYSGQIQLFKGDTIAVQHTNLHLTLNNFRADFIPVQTSAGTTYQASKFQSDVTFSGNSDNVRATILVNHPFVMTGGIYFYQASYGFGGHLQVSRRGKILHLPGTEGRLSPQDAIFLPGTSRAIEYGTLLGPSDPSQTPAGVPLPKEDEYALWIFHDNIPTTNKPVLLRVGSSADAGDGFTITALPPTPSSGLTYRYDPGTDWVGLGCIILVTGFVMALFFVPVKLYAKVSSDKLAAATGAASNLEFAATTTKGNTIYEDDFRTLVAGLRATLPEYRTPEPAKDHVEAYA